MYEHIKATGNGLNGTILLNTGIGDLHVGRTDGDQYGYKNKLRVRVGLRVEREERLDFYQTVDHDHVRNPLSFTITTSVWRPDLHDIVSGGATIAPLHELVDYDNGWDAEKVAALADLAPWHLNTMTAACAHMPNLVTEDDRYGGQRIACGAVNTCEAGSGYTYGAAWLTRPLPESFVPDLIALLGSTDALEQRRVYVHPDLTD